MTCNCGCGGTLPCGCCEGTEILTPAAIANRPGLNAISYRVGTHGTFLETMKAGLSGAALQLRALRTRETNDFAIALLDGWATVGDVLTFYQERIANEGYLRTARERRSILELARLVGYTLRPGVAASTYFAYTLDKPIAIPVVPGKEATAPPVPDPEVIIPKGSRAQSVPGPGELPQSFESSDDLVARPSWNNLQVRLTQPQVITEETRKIYLKGTPNLKPGDPLLIFASPEHLFRVETVTPQPEAERTRVTFVPWQGRAAAPRVLPEVVRDIATRFSVAESFGVVPSTRAAGEVLGRLRELLDQATSGTNGEALKAKLEQEHLPRLRELHETAVAGRFKKVAPWVETLIGELEKALRDGSRDPRSRTPFSSIGTGPGRGPAKGSGLTAVIDSLAKPPSIQLFHRSAEEIYSSNGDFAPRLLTEIRPELKSSLYKAWANVPVTREPSSQVFTFRTRASVFGHNAPPEPIKDRTGAITGSKEWDLQAPVLNTETFEIDLRVEHGGELFSASFKIDRKSTALKKLEDGENRIDFPEADDSVIVNLSRPGGKVKIELKFSKRPIRLTLAGEIEDLQIEASSTGDDPTITIAGVGIVRTTDSRDVVVRGQLQPRSQGRNTEEGDVVWLDADYEGIRPNSPVENKTDPQAKSWIVLERPNALRAGNGDELIPEIVITTILEAKGHSRYDYGLTTPSIRLRLEENWIDPGPDRDKFDIIRGTSVFAQSESLELAEAPIEESVGGRKLELDGLYDGLESGRWLIISGERTDVIPVGTDVSSPQDLAVRGQAEEPTNGIEGVLGTELVRLSNVVQDHKQDLPGDRTHTFLSLAEKLANSYKRESVVLYGNVVAATHGETRKEVLGNGDAGKALQQFALKQSPLTHVAAPIPRGAESTLEVRVNDVLWREIDSLAGQGPNEHCYITRTDDDDQTSVIFGTGQNGARLPTGQENVTAAYRSGIGKPGNVKSDQISLLASRPLGVKGVTNPIAASGGADKESRDQARQNIPVAVTALDRLVSTQDYADFARTFAGIGKASSARLSDGQRRLVHLTIAGADDITIEKTSDLYRNLAKALRDFGDPHLPVSVVLRRLQLLVIQARVRVLPEYLWEKVEPKVRAALLDTFSFERRELGQDVLLSEAVSAIQRVEGVAFVDVDKFDSVDEDKILDHLAGDKSLADVLERKERIPVALARIDLEQTDPKKRIQPAELAYLNAEAADTIILSEIGS